MLHFYLNDRETIERDLPADLTLLAYLRDNCRKHGSKEGCASGDCGACTVVLVQLDDSGQALKYQSINSCITLLGSVHGCMVLTVEDLADGDSLHPVQHAMVTAHASQCGFCTPGFVMSLFALSKSLAAENCCSKGSQPPAQLIEQRTEKWLGGNLCRCTGYRPIIEAANVLQRRAPITDKFDRAAPEIINRLQGIAASERTGEFYRPQSLAALCQLRATMPTAQLLAGGTDLSLLVTQGLQPLPQIIYLGGVTQLDYFTCDDQTLHIGAGLSLDQCADKLATYYPAVGRLLLRFGSLQVRHRGTVGGNIANASPIGDLAPVLLALDADIVLCSVRGVRQIKLRDFFIEYKVTALAVDEIVQELIIPKAVVSCASAILEIYKISKRHDDDISAVCAAFWLEMDTDIIRSIRCGFGGMAAIPKRAEGLEKSLTGEALTAPMLQRARLALDTDFKPLSDARASAHYRTRVAGNLLYRLADDIAQFA